LENYTNGPLSQQQNFTIFSIGNKGTKKQSYKQNNVKANTNPTNINKAMTPPNKTQNQKQRQNTPVTNTSK